MVILFKLAKIHSVMTTGILINLMMIIELNNDYLGSPNDDNCDAS